MRRIYATTFCLFLFGITPKIIAQNIDSLVKCAEDAYKQGQFVKSATIFELAINAGSKNPVVLYNASCSFALSGRKEKAWNYLEQASELGFNYATHVEKDTDLVSLHSDPRWKGFIEKMKPKETRAVFEATINYLYNIAAYAYQYKIRPKSMSGGNNSYKGCFLPTRLKSNSYGTYSIEVVSDTLVNLIAVSNSGNGTVTGKLGSEGCILEWIYTGEFLKFNNK